MDNNFFTEEEKQIEHDFLERGYHIFEIESFDLLENVKNTTFNWAKQLLTLDSKTNRDHFFDNTHQFITPENLNSFKVKMIEQMVNAHDLRSKVFNLSKFHLNTIVGNELCMQRALNLSIQMPNDDKSLLPMHSDVWSGNSPYEVVFWLPLTNCYKTRSMFILPLERNQTFLENIKNYANLSVSEIYDSLKSDFIWLDIPYGHGIIFSHTLMHGNTLNIEDGTRWTFNCRFKSLMTPYGNKQLGESFLPITIKPITRIGHNYIHPTLK